MFSEHLKDQSCAVDLVVAAVDLAVVAVVAAASGPMCVDRVVRLDRASAAVAAPVVDLVAAVAVAVDLHADAVRS